MLVLLAASALLQDVIGGELGLLSKNSPGRRRLVPYTSSARFCPPAPMYLSVMMLFGNRYNNHMTDPTRCSSVQRSTTLLTSKVDETPSPSIVSSRLTWNLSHHLKSSKLHLKHLPLLYLPLPRLPIPRPHLLQQPPQHSHIRSHFGPPVQDAMSTGHDTSRTTFPSGSLEGEYCGGHPLPNNILVC